MTAPLEGVTHLGIDADDTLWHSENRFHETHQRYHALLRDHVDLDVDELERRMLETERRNLRLFGYGAKGFTLSLIETAIEVTEGAIPTAAIATILDFGKELLDHPVELLDGVAEAIDGLRSRGLSLILITKGDLWHQEAKVAASGIAEHFDAIEIVAEKDVTTYRTILERHGVEPGRFAMVGNSVRSDVLPVLEPGRSGGARPVRVPLGARGRGRTGLGPHHVARPGRGPRPPRLTGATRIRPPDPGYEPGMPLSRLLDHQPVRSLDEHRSVGGLVALEDARRVEPEVATSVVTDAGLRGRGGAGFPTGKKWSTVAANAASSGLAPTVVVNAAEGEPGTFGDRTLIRRNPYRVLEGALIAAHAIGPRAVSVVTKDRYTTELGLLTDAADELVATGAAGDVTIDVVAGAGHYLLGEETGLLEAVAGRPPFPRVAPPYRHGTVEVGEAGSGASRLQLAGEGGIAPPTLVNNAETFAHVARIVEHGPDWFRELGTPDSPGTSLFTVTGDVKRGGVAEHPLGTPLREIIEDITGGATGEIAFVMSGVSVGVLLPDQLDTPTTYEAMAAAGSGLGTGGFTVFTTATDPVAVAHGVSRFLAVESCGQCRPCKQGGLEVAAALDLLRSGEGTESTLAELTTLVPSLSDGARCDLGPQHERIITSFLEQFPDATRAHAAEHTGSDPVLVAPIVDIDDEGRVTLDEDHRTKQPDWEHGDSWNGQSPADRYDVAVTVT